MTRRLTGYFLLALFFIREFASDHVRGHGSTAE